MSPISCRCGYKDGDPIHQCHAGRESEYQGTRCPNPVRTDPKFVLRPAILAGVQFKLGAQQVHYCESCYNDAFPPEGTQTANQAYTQALSDGPSDTTRKVASRDPGTALLYARNVDKSYHKDTYHSVFTHPMSSDVFRSHYIYEVPTA